MKKSGLLFALASTSLSWGGAAYAQAASGDQGNAAESGSGLEEIVVTAQRRSQNLQDVPIAISVVTAANLESSGVRSSDELIAATPGVSVTSQQRGAQIYIRGVGTTSVNPGDESNVATYVDGVYMPSSYGNIMSFNNIDRVEVLKGPQGTLFGRNATGGLIHVITKNPEAGFSGKMSLSYGNFDTVEGAGYVTGGSDMIAADFAIYGIHQGKGWGHNLLTGDEVNFKREIALRSKIAFTPSSDDRLTLILDYGKSNTDQGVTRTGRSGAILSAAPGPLGGPAFVYTGSPYDSIMNTQPKPSDVKNESGGVSLRYERQMSANVDLSVMGAYRRTVYHQLLDNDSGPYPILSFFSTFPDTSFQFEALLNGTSGRLKWTAGAFAFHDRALQDVNLRSPIIAAQNVQTYNQQTTQSYSGFMQGSYDITDRTTLTLGGRYTVDRREVFGVTTPLGGASIIVASPLTQNKSWSKFTWNVTLDQKLTDDILVYASQRRGFKSGTFNTTQPTNAPVNPEVLDASEVGLKSELLDRQLRMNLSGYYYKYKDLQVTRVALVNNRIVNQLVNAAQATIKGIDFDATFAPRMDTGNLQIRVGAAYIDAKYSSFPNAPVTVPNGLPAGGNTTILGDASGNRIVRTPKLTFNIGVDYSIPVGPGELGFGVNYYHNSGFFWEPDNRTEQPSYDLLNGQLFFKFGDEGKYRIRAFGRNLTNKTYYLGASESSFGDLGWPAAPRTYGIGFDVAF